MVSSTNPKYFEVQSFVTAGIRYDMQANWVLSSDFDPSWDKISLHDYLDCIQLIHTRKLVLFESGEGGESSKPESKRAICDRIRMKRVEDARFLSAICPTPDLLSDLFESTAASLFLDGGMQKWASRWALKRRCEEWFDRSFGDEVKKQLIDGTLQFEVSSAIAVRLGGRE